MLVNLLTNIEMNPAYTKARLPQLDRKIKQLEEELRDLKKERVRLKGESTKASKET